MNPELNRLSDLLRASVDAGEYAGASVMVIHKGEEIFYTDYGYADVESGRKIARDTIFRIYSQSKPITGTAAVMNIDRGILSPRAMVARFLPGFKEQRYDTEHSQGLAVVSDRPMYVSDLLNMTSVRLSFLSGARSGADAPLRAAFPDGLRRSLNSP